MRRIAVKALPRRESVGLAYDSRMLGLLPYLQNWRPQMQLDRRRASSLKHEHSLQVIHLIQYTIGEAA